MLQHPLTPLLSPKSVAFVGASPRPNMPGSNMLRMARQSGFKGAVYAINPKYPSVEGYTCYPSLAALPERVDHVVLAVANARLEQALEDAIQHGAHAATIFASGYLDNDSEPPLLKRLAAKTKAAGIAVCGSNCMGFYNDEAGFWSVGYPAPREPRSGHMTFITHSGSVFSAFAHHDRRFRFNLCISSGQELVTTVADYMDYALGLHSTRVIGLFIEAVRDPAGFVAALEKAAIRGVPVVALKVGRTPESAKMTLSHSGALSGDDAAHDALFRRYGVARVNTVDELAASMLLFAQGRRCGSGGLAAVFDSGGECEMGTDLASDMGVPFARINDATRAKLAARLDYGLEPRNPLDAWGTGVDFSNIFRDCMKALHDDPDTALMVQFADIGSDSYIHEGYFEAHKAIIDQTAKPVAVATNYTQVQHDALVAKFEAIGVPVIDGTAAALTAIRNMLAYRDFGQRGIANLEPPPAGARARWAKRLMEPRPLGEAEGLQLFADYGIATIPFRIAESAEDAVAAAAALGFPVALKTARPDILHKTDSDGVRLGLRDASEVRSAHIDIAARLGARVLIAPMSEPGVDVMLGMTLDAQFGPVVVIGAGGILVEVLGAVTHELAPFDPATARRAVERLAPLKRLLAGVRGRPASEIDALCALIARFSVMCADLAPLAAEIDANPVIAGATGAIVVDAAVIPRAAAGH